MGIVTFVDETTAGSRSDGRPLEIAEEKLTVRELIRRRVAQEDAEHGARTPRGTDPDRRTALAWESFGRNGFLILVGDRQVTGLDEEIELAHDTEVTFLRLVPLVGG
ncbi:hypothetical protein [Streptomyces sp. NPDC053367]|uniref:hypothetical protein n=1 Tax=Streptomyces sp. NPDC053367 TaxID=3365700 RepID=UPI0037D0BD4A